MHSPQVSGPRGDSVQGARAGGVALLVAIHGSCVLFGTVPGLVLGVAGRVSRDVAKDLLHKRRHLCHQEIRSVVVLVHALGRGVVVCRFNGHIRRVHCIHKVALVVHLVVFEEMVRCRSVG